MRDKPLIHLDAILREPIPPIRWILPPWVTRHSKTVFFGEWGSMKSWVLLHMSLCLASGIPWFGYTTIPQRVLYVDEEMNERTLRARLKRLASGLGITGNHPLSLLSHSGVQFNAQGADNLMHYLNRQQFKPSVIIAETMRRLMIGEENEAKDVAQFWRNIDPLSQQGVTFIVAHHMRKAKTDGPDPAKDRASGSTDILAGCNVGIALTRPKDDTLIMNCVKNQDVESGIPITVKVHSEPDPGPFYIERVREHETVWEIAMMKLCESHPTLTHNAIYELYPSQIGISKRTYFRRMLQISCSHVQLVRPVSKSVQPAESLSP